MNIGIKAYEWTECESQGIGGMSRKETVSAASFEHMQAAGKHELIIDRPDPAYGILYQIGKLVAESECERDSCNGNQSFLPSKLPDQ